MTGHSERILDESGAVVGSNDPNVLTDEISRRRSFFRHDECEASWSLPGLITQAICPNCDVGVDVNMQCERHIEADADDSGYLSCEWCGWTDRPACAHGILEGEFCAQCPGGGW